MNKTKRILCSLLTICLVAMPAVMSVSSFGAEDISSLQQQLQELEQKNEEYQAILDKTQADINEKEEYSKALISKIEVLDDKMAITRNSIEKLNKDISGKQAEIDKANADIDSQIDVLRERLRIIYMAGEVSNIEILLGAKDFSDLLDKAMLVETLSSYDQKLIEGINTELEKITEQKKSLEADKKELEATQASLKSDMDEFNNLLEENDEILRTLYAESEDAEAALKSAAHESEEIEAQIQRYYASQNQSSSGSSGSSGGSGSGSSGSSNSGSSGNSGGGSVSGGVNVPAGGGYVWPTPGFYYLSSEWSENRYTYNHGGIDIAGAGIMGSPCLAADSGTVIYANNSCPHNWGKYGSCGCGGGYGNYVMIDHGNGKMTVYGHFTNAIVSIGQHVNKGQTIGYVGSTGNSSGPHLHFECRYNGVKYNPMSEY